MSDDKKFLGAMRSNKRKTYGVSLSKNDISSEQIPSDSLPSSVTTPRSLSKILNALDATSSSKIQNAFGATTNLDELTRMRPKTAETNPHIPVAKTCAKFGKGFEKMMSASQRFFLLICYKDRSNYKSNRYIPYEKRSEYRRYSFFNVPAWNYFAATRQVMPGPNDEIPSADQYWSENWEVAGIVITEQAEEKYFRQDNKYISGERAFNICQYGYAMTVNTWGENIRKLTNLFLILKKEDLPDEYIIDPYSQNGVKPKSYGSVNSESGEVKNITNKPFQLSFFADYRYDIPPLSALEYTDEHGNKCIGKYIYVGRVIDTYDSPEVRKRVSKFSHYDASSMINLPKIEISFNPSREVHEQYV
jgi:hypothetical protein